MAADLRKLADELPSADASSWKEPVAEVLKALDQAPDAVRDRLAAWRKAKARAASPPHAQFALAMSGYVAGIELAVPDLKAAEILWKARDLVASYLCQPRRACAASCSPSLMASTGSPPSVRPTCVGGWKCSHGSSSSCRRREMMGRRSRK